MSERARSEYVMSEPAGAAPQVGRWLWALEDARRRTERTLDGLTDEVLNWAPPGGGDAIGTLLYHVDAIEIDWLYADVLEGRPFPGEIEAWFPYDVRDAQGRLTPVSGESLAGHERRLAAVRQHLLAVFRDMSLAEFRRVRRLPAYDVTPEWVLHHLMQHEAEHRGQIGVLRELAAHRGGEV